MSENVGEYSCPAALGLLLITVGTIAGAWAFQLIGGYMPCPLCLQQRWPYYTVIPIMLLIFLFSRTNGASGLVRAGLVVCGLIMLISAGLGGHHVGVEWGWWPGPTSCAAGAGLDSGQILPDLSKNDVIRCDEVQRRMFGLSFAGWNFVISLFAAFLAFRGARRAPEV